MNNRSTTTESPQIVKADPLNHTEPCRSLCIKRLPESIWLRVHDNAHRSRLRLQDYLATILKDCEPVPPTTS